MWSLCAVLPHHKLKEKRDGSEGRCVFVCHDVWEPCVLEIVEPQVCTLGRRFSAVRCLHQSLIKHHSVYTCP